MEFIYQQKTDEEIINHTLEITNRNTVTHKSDKGKQCFMSLDILEDYLKEISLSVQDFPNLEKYVYSKLDLLSLINTVATKIPNGDLNYYYFNQSVVLDIENIKEDYYIKITIDLLTRELFVVAGNLNFTSFDNSIFAKRFDYRLAGNWSYLPNMLPIFLEEVIQYIKNYKEDNLNAVYLHRRNHRDNT